MKDKRFLGVLVLLALASLVLVACATPAGQAPITVIQTVQVPQQVEVTRVVEATAAPVVVNTPDPEQVITITWWGTERGRDTAATRALHFQLAQAYEAAHPNTRVAVSLFPSRAFGNRVLTAISAGQGPDVFYHFFPTDTATQGFLEDLTPYLEASGVDPQERWFPIGNSRAVYEGKYYGLPRDATAGFIVYNRDLFDAAGLEYPQADWTVEDYRQAALQMTDASKDQYGAGSIEGSVGCFQWSSFSFNLGTDMVSPDGKKVAGFMDTPEAIKAIKWCLDLTATDKVTPPSAMVEQFGETTFISGQVGMEHVSTWELPAIRERADFNWGVVAPPRADADTPEVSWTDSYIMYMNSQSQNKQRAWEFMEWLTGPEAGKLIAESGVWTPALPSVWEEMNWQDDPILSVAWEELNKEGRVPNYLRSQYYAECVGPAFDSFWTSYVVEEKQDGLEQLIRDETAKAQDCLDKNYNN